MTADRARWRWARRCSCPRRPGSPRSAPRSAPRPGRAARCCRRPRPRGRSPSRWTPSQQSDVKVRRQGVHHAARQPDHAGRRVLRGHRRHQAAERRGGHEHADHHRRRHARPTRPPPGSLDQAPVQVSITTATVHGALIVPVDALVWRCGRRVRRRGRRARRHARAVPVTLGLFDDADGTVQVSGSGLQPASTSWSRRYEHRDGRAGPRGGPGRRGTAAPPGRCSSWPR